MGAGAWHRRALAAGLGDESRAPGHAPGAAEIAEGAAPRGLVELVPVAPSGAVGGSARYVLELAGTRLEFGDDAAVTTLRRVIEALRR